MQLFDIKNKIVTEIQKFPKTYLVIDECSDFKYLICHATFKNGIEDEFLIHITVGDDDKIMLTADIDEFSNLHRSGWEKAIIGDIKYFEKQINK